MVKDVEELSLETITQMKSSYIEGFSPVEIGREVGLDPSTVRNHLIRTGVKLRNISEALQAQVKRGVFPRLREKVCVICGQKFISRSHKRITCSRKCWGKLYYPNHREQQKAIRNRHHAKYPEAAAKASRRHKQLLDRLWQPTGYRHHTAELVISSEIFVARNILPRYNFTDIWLMREFNTYFPFDILAKLNQQECGIEVTTYRNKEIPVKYLPLFERLGIKIYVCHLKPDFTWYYLRELAPGENRSSCEAPFTAYAKARGSQLCL